MHKSTTNKREWLKPFLDLSYADGVCQKNSSKHPLIDDHTIVHDIGMHPTNIMY